MNQHILKGSNIGLKNVGLPCIGYKKIYDIIWPSWTIDCQKLYKISDKVIEFLTEIKKNWKVELTTGGKTLAEIKIQRDIFQGEALSPLLFLILII